MDNTLSDTDFGANVDFCGGRRTQSGTQTSNFLQRMLDENEGLWKGPILRRS